MERARLSRLLVISGDLQFVDSGAPWLVRVTLLRHLSKDQAAMEKAIQSSALDWTIVRPTRLTNGDLTGVYRVETGNLPPGAKPISRRNVAHLLLATAERGEHVHQVVGLAR
jgi:uncharacterized protein YbjT (DUF2867 family)